MPTDSEAGELQKDRERRRAAERERIARERDARRAEVARLRTAGAPEPRSRAEGAARAPPPALAADGRALATRSAPRGNASAGAVPHREIGRPIRPPEVDRFLAVDPAERFDLEQINRLAVAGLADASTGDPELRRQLASRAAGLIVRLRQEIDDPLTAGAFLRDRTLEWYRASGTVAAWAEEATPRWSGLFADSRRTGGRLDPWVVTRLRAAYEALAPGLPVVGRLRRGLRPRHGDPASAARTPRQQILGEVAQAFLDDLAARPRGPGTGTPLVHLSELALRRQVPTVNEALATLFGSPETGPFVVLHPNRYPECEELSIRPPPVTAAGAALAYRLAPAVAGRRPAARARSAGETAGPEGVEPADEFTGEEEGGSIWDAPSVAAAAWERHVEGRRRERRHLDSPPKEYRGRPAYESLRALLLGSAEFRKGFLAVRWRGRPAGLPLLATLLQRGNIAPEVATDHEYLEAELTAAVGEEGTARPETDVWRFEGWTVRREGSSPSEFRYVAEHDGAGG